MDDVSEIMTPDDVAGFLQLHVKTVYKLASIGRLPGVRIGRSWRFRRAEVLAFVRAPHVERPRRVRRDPLADLGATAPDD